MKFYEDKTYIKMCEKAHNIIIPNFAIQTIGYAYPGIVWQDGNCFYNEHSISIPSNSDKLIWLPRQDQLIEMIILENHKFGFLIRSFPPYKPEYRWLVGNNVIGTLHDYDGFYDETLEGGLLKWLMKIKYNKTWKGEDWIDIAKD